MPICQWPISVLDQPANRACLTHIIPYHISAWDGQAARWMDEWYLYKELPLVGELWEFIKWVQEEVVVYISSLKFVPQFSCFKVMRTISYFPIILCGFPSGKWDTRSQQDDEVNKDEKKPQLFQRNLRNILLIIIVCFDLNFSQSSKYFADL